MATVPCRSLIASRWCGWITSLSPRFAVAWLGLGPSWRVDLSDAPLTVKELDRMRDTGRMVALTSSSAAARRCEGAPVLDVHLDQDDAQSVFSLIMIDGVGLFQPVPPMTAR